MEYPGIIVSCRIGDVGLQLGKETRLRKRLETICIEVLVKSVKLNWAPSEQEENEPGICQGKTI